MVRAFRQGAAPQLAHPRTVFVVGVGGRIIVRNGTSPAALVRRGFPMPPARPPRRRDGIESRVMLYSPVQTWTPPEELGSDAETLIMGPPPRLRRLAHIAQTDDEVENALEDVLDDMRSGVHSSLGPSDIENVDVSPFSDNVLSAAMILSSLPYGDAKCVDVEEGSGGGLALSGDPAVLLSFMQARLDAAGDESD